jgi:putative heme-binding domain-containing protein
VAYTLGEWKQPAAGLALAELLRPDEDRFVRAAAMSSVLPHASTIISHLQGQGPVAQPVLIEIATASNNAAALAGILAELVQPVAAAARLQQFSALGTLLDWLQRSNKTLGQLGAGGDPAMVRAVAASDQIFAQARTVAVDGAAPAAERAAAIKLLGRGRTRQAEDVTLLAGLLAPQSPTLVQLAAVAALGRINRPEVPDRLLASWSGYVPAVRAAVLELLTSRPAWANVLLDRVEADRTMLGQIDPGRRVALTQYGNARLAERAAAIFNGAIDQNRQKVIDRYLAAVPALTGDPRRGATTFQNICSACHRFGAVPGASIGPDLAAVKDRSADYLVTHILDPNRAVEDRYVLYSVMTQDNRVLAGMLASESGNSIRLVGLDGVEQTILRTDVRSLASTARSLMPDGLEGAVDGQAMADLVAFLAGGAK